MNLCGRPPYQKGSAKKRSKKPTAADIRYREKVRSLGCILRHLNIEHQHGRKIDAHHAGTGGGGRKDHRKIIPLCEPMHTGPDGIDGRQNYSKISWQEHYGVTEETMLAKVDELLNHPHRSYHDDD